MSDESSNGESESGNSESKDDCRKRKKKSKKTKKRKKSQRTGNTSSPPSVLAPLVCAGAFRCVSEDNFYGQINENKWRNQCHGPTDNMASSHINDSTGSNASAALPQIVDYATFVAQRASQNGNARLQGYHSS